jgi:type II restriction/modification system DNA methylase subunit YeeA
MPVNTAALKTFAPAMRRQLLEAVGRKLDLLLHSQTPDTLSTYAEQITELREQVAENRGQLVERVSYTWFNRLCALRYLDARGWHPFGCRVLMPAAEGETQPELLKLMRAGSLPAELKPLTNEARLHGLLDGQIPPAIAVADPQGEVYRELVLASCRSYHQLLPELFEGLDDASELLLPDDLLSEGSIAGGFRSEISDADCEDVEIIGWLYQFYISEKKDQVIGKVVKSEDIPAATQLFTPNWIVKYMVQNSLGATWLASYPDSPLKGQMEFYIEPAEQTLEVQAQLAAITPESLDPEALTLIDPACGSGHILVEAYDLLKAIYLERGYRQRDIPELILTKNLYGLDICPRAVQLSSFSLLMKGREDDRRLIERGIQFNLMALHDSTGLNVERLAASVDLTAAGLSRADVRILAELFAHATTFGSLIQVPNLLAAKLQLLSSLTEKHGENLLTVVDLQRLRKLVRQASILSQRYDAVVANPPYMGNGGMNSAVKQFAISFFPHSKSDLFACFLSRSMTLAKEHGRIGIVAPYVWMFLSSYEQLRGQIISETSLSSLIQLEYNAFEPACIPVATFVLSRHHMHGFISSCIKLSDFKGHQNQAPKVIEAIENPRCGWLHRSIFDEFTHIPGKPIAFWLSPAITRLFTSAESLDDICETKVGFMTSNNEKYLRRPWEVSSSKMVLDASSVDQVKHISPKWVPHNKGGGYRKWYGNQDFLVDWSGFANQYSSRYRKTFFVECMSWSEITSSDLSFRYFPRGFTFNIKGMSAFANSRKTLAELLCIANSKVISYISGAINPTLSFGVNNFRALPALAAESDILDRLGDSLVSLSKNDWDAYERSWNFQRCPLLEVFEENMPLKVFESYSAWIARSRAAIAETKELEAENNRLFIDAYGLEGEINTEVPNDQITLTVNPAYRYGGNLSETEQWDRFRRDSIAEFLSYASGCMMGRYSLDQPGLILADSRDSQAEQLTAYETKVSRPLSEVQFKPDADGIIPVLDGEWFEDDIVARTREFLAVTFPESSVGENLRFIEEALGKDIRKYFCSEFYKDHLQTYKKRPIYWLVQSPKKGFACLVYLHRYTKDTLNQVLNNYFRPYLQKLEARLAQLGLDQLNDDLPARERTAARKEADKITKVLKECQAWEQDSLLPLAQQRIELDLDDGVKVNYLKLQDVLAPIPGLAAKED